MAGTINLSRTDSNRSLSMVLRRQSQLYDLHTHLLGMGNASFWIDTILMDEAVMPTNKTFRTNETTRQELCPLVWDQIGNSGFVDGREAANFFNYITKEITLPNEKQHFNIVMEQIKQKKFSPVLETLIKEDFYEELLDRTLTFHKNFSYDVVLTLCHLSESLGVKKIDGVDIAQVAITEKLGVYPPKKINFREWVIFNAREQKFRIVQGIQVAELRRLIKCDPKAPSKAKELARAYIINAFSMCDAQGTAARHVDLHNFHGSFTPDFYPRRFALKDSIYSQRLDILALLIAHIIDRYQTCLPPVKYCEFSISVNDLSQPWVFDVLRSVRVYNQTTWGQMNKKNRTYIPKNELSSFSQLVLNNHFPHLEFAFTGPASDNSEIVHPPVPQVTYKFLAGFDRRKIKSSRFKNTDEALRFLLKYPQQAILLMIREIIKSKKEATSLAMNITEQPTTTDSNGEQPTTTVSPVQQPTTTDNNGGQPITTMNTKGQSTITTNKENVFSDFVTQLDKLESNDNTMPAFYEWVVGLDLFGDELGYPYCPFVTRRFINYILKRREIEKKAKSKNMFGVRIHCGENVTFADDSTPAYRLFVAHMYIVFRCLRYLQQELKKGIRIGHGIAFDRILGGTMSKSRHRKSSVLLAEIREHAKYLMKSIAFEVNITSNEYLLGQTLRQGDDRQPLRLDGLFGKTHIILATDDDGIWPIDRCAFTHPDHQSLTAEYCRAISSDLIKDFSQLTSILKDTKDFCFWNMGGVLPKPSVDDALPADDALINTVIIHPDIIRRLRALYIGKPIKINPDFERFATNTQNIEPIKWTNEYGALRVAFICICANHPKSDQNDAIKLRIRKDYYILFGKNETEFNSIYDFWRGVRSELIFSNTDIQISQTSRIGHYVRLKKDGEKTHLVYSSPENDNLTQSQDKSLIEFIYQFRLFGYTIHAYGNEINIKDTIEVLEKQVNNDNHDEAYKDMTLYLYTNENIFMYVRHKLGKSFNLTVNPHPSKRKKNKQNFLYVLSPSASAATAALHLICERISGKPSVNDSDVLFGMLTTDDAKSQQATEHVPTQINVNELLHSESTSVKKLIVDPSKENTDDRLNHDAEENHGS